MTRRSWPVLLLVAVVLVAVAATVASANDDGPALVQPGAPVADAVARSGAVELAAGVHDGFVLDESATVRGGPGAVVEGGIVIRADRARLVGLRVVGGDAGVRIDGARDVTLRDVVVEGAIWHGIEVVAGTVDISGCTVTGLTHHLAQGIEIRNTNGMGRSRVQGCTVNGGQEGIVSHVSRVEIRDNVVTGTTMRGIAVTEMSEGLVEHNRVSHAMGTGLFCGDMSHCEIRDNDVHDVAADPAGIRSRSGQSLVTWYYSTVRLTDNDFAARTAEGDAVGIYHGSVETERFPLSHWPAGWQGALPGVAVTAIALAALVAARWLLAPAIARLARRWSRRRPAPEITSLGAWAFLVTGGVQAAHFLEHGVQVHQVYVADAEVRSGLAGARFDTEWLHLGFNSVVLFGAVLGVVLARAELARRFPRVLPWLLAGIALQGWHVAEHVARVLQYLDTGVSPSPGILGGELGLVWFHYGINVPITAALALIGAAWVRSRSRHLWAGLGSGRPAPAL